jgi:hypothetical protein
MSSFKTLVFLFFTVFSFHSLLYNSTNTAHTKEIKALLMAKKGVALETKLRRQVGEKVQDLFKMPH